jgi:hypothetical protein
MADIPIIYGTLDYCRDPATGYISKWAHAILNRLKPSHMEENDSGTGFRLWCLGTLPDDTDRFTGFGPQMSAGEMPDVAYLNIIHAVSDDEKDILVGPEPVWNCLDLAVTTEGLQGVALEDRTEEIHKIAASFIPPDDCVEIESRSSVKIEMDATPIFDSPEQITAYYQDQMKVLDPGNSKHLATIKQFEKLQAMKLDELFQSKYIPVANDILRHGDPLKERIKYVQSGHYGDTAAIRTDILVGHSAFLEEHNRLHEDVVGDPAIGKTHHVDMTVSTFPEENVIYLTDMSPKSFYYYAKDHDLSNKVLILNDANKDHVPLLKTMRDDGTMNPRHLTVIDGKAVDLLLNGRPATIVSSVNPLRDLQGQATSRALMTTCEIPDDQTECKVKDSIRSRHRFGSISKSQNDTKRYVLQAMVKVLLKDGTPRVLIPFRAEEPSVLNRRATAQFQRLIAASAYIYQFQRPILYVIGDDATPERFVLATSKDLEVAASVIFAFGDVHKFKVNPKAVSIMKVLPSEEPNPDLDGGFMTVPKIHDATCIPQSTVKVYMEDLYEAGLVNKIQIKAPGSPFAWWIDPAIANGLAKQDISEISNASGSSEHFASFSQDPELAKYMAKNSSDCLKSSISSFFHELAIINKDKRMDMIVNDKDAYNWDDILPAYLSNFVG